MKKKFSGQLYETENKIQFHYFFLNHYCLITGNRGNILNINNFSQLVINIQKQHKNTKMYNQFYFQLKAPSPLTGNTKKGTGSIIEKVTSQ